MKKTIIVILLVVVGFLVLSFSFSPDRTFNIKQFNAIGSHRYTGTEISTDGCFLKFKNAKGKIVILSGYGIEVKEQ